MIFGGVNIYMKSNQTNIYQLLIQLAKQIKGENPVIRNDRRNHDQLQSFISSNQSILEILRQFLKNTYEIPIEFTKRWFDCHIWELFLLRKMARLLLADGLLHETTGNFDAAAGSYIDIIRLGIQMCGGLIIDKITASVIIGIGQELLIKITPYLSKNIIVNLVNELLFLSESEEDPRVTLQREKDWEQHILKYYIRLPFFVFDDKNIEQQFLRFANMYRAALRLTIMELAINLFKQDQQQLPINLEQLVPSYLPQLPIDPLSGKSFIYRIEEDKIRLYSVGYNGKDDGGEGDDVTAQIWLRKQDPIFRKTYYGEGVWFEVLYF